MENKITIPKFEPQHQELKDEILKQIDELNSQETNGGEWIYVDKIGICWKPVCDQMGAPITTPVDGPPLVLSKLVEWGKLINFDNLPLNSVVLIKLNVDDPTHVNTMQRAIAKQVLEPRIEKLKENRTCILFMQSGDDISVMTEAEMNQAGWEKKEKSRIII